MSRLDLNVSRPSPRSAGRPRGCGADQAEKAVHDHDEGGQVGGRDAGQRRVCCLVALCLHSRRSCRALLRQGDQGRAPIRGMGSAFHEPVRLEGVNKRGDVPGRAAQCPAELSLDQRAGAPQHDDHLSA